MKSEMIQGTDGGQSQPVHLVPVATVIGSGMDQ